MEYDLNQNELEIILLMREASRNASPDERHAIIEAVKNTLKKYPSEED